MRTRLAGVAANRETSERAGDFLTGATWMIYDSECSGRCICVIGPRSPDLLSRHFCSDLEPSFRIRKKKKEKMANNLSIIITRYLLYPRCCLLITFNPFADPSSLLWFLPQYNRTTAFFFLFPPPRLVCLCGALTRCRCHSSLAASGVWVSALFVAVWFWRGEVSHLPQSISAQSPSGCCCCCCCRRCFCLFF